MLILIIILVLFLGGRARHDIVDSLHRLHVGGFPLRPNVGKPSRPCSRSVAICIPPLSLVAASSLPVVESDIYLEVNCELAIGGDDRFEASRNWR
jgi:hypothetical protein